MTWVTWRQQRTETLIAAAILALLAALLIPTGMHMASVYHHDGLATCAPNSGAPGCAEAVQAFTARFEHFSGLLGWLNLVPGVVGIALAAPFILELETGTYRLVWTQSITRRRWLAGKLGITVAAALIAALVMTVLMTWWRTPLDHLNGRMSPNVFDFEGTVGGGYILFALGVSLAVGAVWRRTVPALLIGFATYIVARVAVQDWLRQRYEAPLTRTWPITRGLDSSHLQRAWIISEQPSDKAGHSVTPVLSALHTCVEGAKTGLRTRPVDPACLTRHGAGYNHAVFQPAGRFWLFQGIETGLFAGVGLALILFAAWWVHERAA